MTNTLKFKLASAAISGVLLVAQPALSSDYDVAADTSGEYFLDAVRVDGNPWTGSDTNVSRGQSYDIEIDLSYSRFGIGLLGAFVQEYSPFQQVDLNIAGPSGDLVASLSSASPDVTDVTTDGTVVVPGIFGLGNGILDGDQVNSAQWLLSGEAILFDSSFVAGVYDISFTRTPNPFDSDGLFPVLFNIQQEITLVPVPATLALFGLGLLGFAGLRRRTAARR